MGRKLRHLLMFLLIILKEPNMQVAGWWRSSKEAKADRSCAPSSAQKTGRSCAPPRCECRYLGLTRITLNLPASIMELDLGKNQITMIQKGAFANLPQLQKLYLYHNKITMIQEGAFVNIPQLQELNLSYNKITMIQEDTFVNLPKLQVLNLSRNKITMIQEGSFINLTRLQKLYLSNNQITLIQPGTFANLPGLLELWLYNNQITMIQEGAFVNLPQLQKLALSSNQIRIIQKSSFVNLTRLQESDLSFNQITSIQPGAFANLPELRELHLTHNKIKMIQKGTFVNLPQLQKLSLMDNKLSAITPLAFSLLPSNLDIRLVGNPWQCDCKMVPFRLDSTEFPLFKDQITCVEPANLRGQKLAAVSPEELLCPETTTSVLPVDVQVTLKFNNSYTGTTADSTVKNKKDKTRPTIASTLQSNSFHADTQITSNDYYNSTTADLKAGIALIGTVILTIWCKRRTKNPPPGSSSGPNSNIALRRLNMTGPTTSQQNALYKVVGQSEATNKSIPNSTATVATSGHDHRYEDMTH
ncbi:leucine-rich repeat-containing protein 15-like [Branchiostoma floridae]|uniref:Leucine-rich repeat-containing protein 15-like n=1 Tax=Branchiostoma floridae TaxID=7739 RepID=A0A9J7LH65_BRAFL|nr:leucine-rich repeat-containing protein 15-like [Branchiostoma floridae]